MNVQSQGLFTRTNDTVCEEQATGNLFEGGPANVEEFISSIVEDLVSHGDKAYKSNDHPNDNIYYEEAEVDYDEEKYDDDDDEDDDMQTLEEWRNELERENAEFTRTLTV